MASLHRSNSELSFAAALDAATGIGFPTLTSTSSDYKEDWDPAFESMNFELDLGFDTFLSATAGDFMDPFITTQSTPSVFDELLDCCSSSNCSESEASVSEKDEVEDATTQLIAKRSRKRKNSSTTCVVTATSKSCAPKKVKVCTKNKRVPVAAPSPVERMYLRRYDILHEILEAWNTGGIEDMEEIADDVYDEEVSLISPDYRNGLHGVKAILHHWGLLLDAFPDGIMEEYNIERDDAEGQKMNVSWVFSGTQVFELFGVVPRHKKITIRGSSTFTFKGDKICKMVLSWNYQDALMQLTGSPNLPTNHKTQKMMKSTISSSCSNR